MASSTGSSPCVFCQIVSGDVAAGRVWETERVAVFLDTKPLFHGHCLVVPREHFATMTDTPPDLVGELFRVARLVAMAVKEGLGAQGSFVAVNNAVSQSVPHLHVHVVPRTKGDGLKGFFWPRTKYRDEAHLQEVAEQLRGAMEGLRGGSSSVANTSY